MKIEDVVSNRGHPKERLAGPIGVPSLKALLDNPGAANDVPAEAVPALLAEAGKEIAERETLKLLLSLRLALSRPNGRAYHGQELVSDEDWINVKEASRISGFSVKWFYRHWKQLPFARRPSRKGLRFSKSGLLKWIAQQRA
jgi:hypothetical protein